jgi:hypothetical protein
LSVLCSSSRDLSIKRRKENKDGMVERLQIDTLNYCSKDKVQNGYEIITACVGWVACCQSSHKELKEELKWDFYEMFICCVDDDDWSAL